LKSILEFANRLVKSDQLVAKRSAYLQVQLGKYLVEPLDQIEKGFVDKAVRVDEHQAFTMLQYQIRIVHEELVQVVQRFVLVVFALVSLGEHGQVSFHFVHEVRLNRVGQLVQSGEQTCVA
jgi:hypothetical protein